jgi:ubiquitin C-terminal hydrolase
VPNEILNKNTEIKKLLSYKTKTLLDNNNPKYHQSDTQKKNPLLYFEKNIRLKIFPPYLVIHIDRVNPFLGTFNKIKITPNQEIKNLKLFGIVVQLGFQSGEKYTGWKKGMKMQIGGGHYISYFLCEDEWYSYNDLGPDIDYIGSYDDLLDESNVLTRGILYFYSK